MPHTNLSTVWTDEKVEATVTSEYVHSQLRTNEIPLLNQTLYFGGDLTDDTYQDWILTRAKRLFLILVSIGVPEQIFGVVDDSYDDDDLPIAEEAVPDLKLSLEPDKSLDRRFFRTQFRFLTRILEDGEHIRYADEENVPINALGLKAPFGKDNSDKVKLPSNVSKVYLRKRIVIDKQTTEEDLLAEIAANKCLTHQHVTSVFASYLYQKSFYILTTPAAEYNLKSFLTDIPKSFDTLSKSERRHILVNWPHCLASALTWLHANDAHHGAIRPSNIFIDQNFVIFLGSLDGEGFLYSSTKSDDIESYQYAAPERWKRAVTVQSTGSSKVALPSGGRTARRTTTKRRQASSSDSRSRTDSASGTSQLEFGGPNAAAYAFLPTSKSNFARLRLSTAVPASLPSTARSRNAIPSENASIKSQETVRRTHNRPSTRGRAPSVVSSNSSGSRLPIKTPADAIFVAGPDTRTAVVQTWRSVEHDSLAADVFSLGAVILDILTILCKRTFSSFARHRSAKNRNAGRGGGLADASFHANLGQVTSWAQILADDAEKKVKKDDSHVFRAVSPIVQITIQCMDRSPSARLRCSVLEQKLEEYITKYTSSTSLHCVAEHVPLPDPPQPARPAESIITPSVPPTPIIEERDDLKSAVYMTGMKDIPIRGKAPYRSPITNFGADRSVSSFNSFAFDLDGYSDTVVGEHDLSRQTSVHRQYYANEDRNDSRSRSRSRPRHVQQHWEYHHSNDSAVDPRLSTSDDTGAFTFVNYSPSPSDDESVRGTPFAFPKPSTKAPDRKLPPLPTTRDGPPRRKKEHAPPPPKTSHDYRRGVRDNFETHPARLSSLHTANHRKHQVVDDIIRTDRSGLESRSSTRRRDRLLQEEARYRGMI